MSVDKARPQREPLDSLCSNDHIPRTDEEYQDNPWETWLDWSGQKWCAHRRLILASRLESQSAGAAVFPDLKALLLAMPDVGEDADFNRTPEDPRDIDLS